MSKKNLFRTTALAFGAALTISIGCASQGGSGMGCGGGSTTSGVNCPSGTYQDPSQPNCTDATTCCLKDTQAQLNRVEPGATGSTSQGASAETSSPGEP